MDTQTRCSQSTFAIRLWSVSLVEILSLQRRLLIFFSGQTLIDDIINAVNTIVYRGIEAIENGLLGIPFQTLGFANSKKTLSNGEAAHNEYPEAQDEIENGVHQLETLLEATVDKAFDKFEIYTLRNILTVPDELAGWIRLGHYDVRFLAIPSCL